MRLNGLLKKSSSVLDPEESVADRIIRAKLSPIKDFFFSSGHLFCYSIYIFLEVLNYAQSCNAAVAVNFPSVGCIKDSLGLKVPHSTDLTTHSNAESLIGQ